MPEHLAQKYKKEFEDALLSDRGAQFDLSNGWVREGEWYWDNGYNGDLFDAAADYILELEAELAEAKQRIL